MREIEVIHGEGLLRLFSRLGGRLSARYAQCSNVSQAEKLLNNEYFDHALLEAANDLRDWRLGHDHRRAACSAPHLSGQVVTLFLPLLGSGSSGGSPRAIAIASHTLVMRRDGDGGGFG